MPAKLFASSLALGALIGCSAARPAATTAPALPEPPVLAVAPVGHWHVFTRKKVTVSATDAHGRGVPGLDLQIEIAAARGARTELASSKGLVHDEGGGRYTFDFTPTETGAYALLARSGAGVSPPLAFEIARDGEEGIRVDAGGTSFVYQIRYVWLPGEIHASDQKVKLSFEVMRGIPRGSDIDWSKPWSNAFDHVDAAREPVVVVESEGLREQLAASYKGLGIYEAERSFPAAEVGPKGREYRVRLTLFDPVSGAKVTHAEAYRLRALP